MSVRMLGVGSPPDPSRKAFNSYHHSFHSQACDPSLVSPQLQTREMSYCTLQSRSCTIMPSFPVTREILLDGRLPRQHTKVENRICTRDSFMVRTLSTACASFCVIPLVQLATVQPLCYRTTHSTPRVSPLITLERYCTPDDQLLTTSIASALL